MELCTCRYTVAVVVALASPIGDWHIALVAFNVWQTRETLRDINELQGAREQRLAFWISLLMQITCFPADRLGRARAIDV